MCVGVCVHLSGKVFGSEHDRNDSDEEKESPFIEDDPKKVLTKKYLCVCVLSHNNIIFSPLWYYKNIHLENQRN